MIAGSPLLQALRLLDLEPRRVLTAVLAGIAALGSAIALAALSAWLITRAWQMPPVLDLSIAVVAVRALGIGRGISRYLERLATHDVALRGTVAARSNMFEQLASGDSAVTVGARRGDLLARTGADVDALGDVVIRALVPIAVASVTSVVSVALVALWSPASAAVLAAGLLVSGVVAPTLFARAAKSAESAASSARTAFAADVTSALDHASELRVAGRLTDSIDDARAAEAAAVRENHAATRLSAFATAATPLATGVSVVAALVFGITMFGTGSGFSGGTDPMALAIVVLLPLSAFEATSVLPSAAVALLRARAAAPRIIDLLGRSAAAEGHLSVEPGATLSCSDLRCAQPGSPMTTRSVDLTIGPGSRLAIVGPSGCGKTTLAATLAGLLPPADGSVTLGGVSLENVDPVDVRRHVMFFAEDAHIFDTSVLENLRVVRGDLDERDALTLLDSVGLGEWVADLPDGIHTSLGGGARALSGGQRRRLLLARALTCSASILVLDEPTEHLDVDSSDQFLRELLGPNSTLVERDRAVVVITHRPVPSGVSTLRMTAGGELKNIVAEVAELA